MNAVKLKDQQAKGIKAFFEGRRKACLFYKISARWVGLFVCVFLFIYLFIIICRRFPFALQNGSKILSVLKETAAWRKKLKLGGDF